MTAQEGVPDAGQETVFQRAQRTEEFESLRRRFRAFVLPLTVVFLVWYAVYVLLAIYAKDFMAQPVFGSINVAMLFGLGQFVSTFAITTIYVRWANNSFDPEAEAMRESIEKELGVN